MSRLLLETLPHPEFVSMGATETPSRKIFYMEEDILIKYFEYSNEYIELIKKEKSFLNIGFTINFIIDLDFQKSPTYFGTYHIEARVFSAFLGKHKISLACISPSENYGIFEMYYFHKNPELDLFNTLIEKTEDAKNIVTDYLKFIKEK